MSEQKIIAHMPAEFHHFGAAKVGETSETQTLTLHFTAAAELAKIIATPDFKVEAGGTCIEGDFYEANGSCTVVARFRPQGPGHRLGSLTVTYSSAAEPLAIGLGGYGYAPVASFSPAQITTVAATYVDKIGALKGATSLTVSAGDTLYVADTAHNLVRFLNSGGVLTNLPTAFTITDPTGIAVDPFGDVIFSENSPAALQVLHVGNSATVYSPGSNSCTVGDTCQFYLGSWNGPGALALDSGGSIFLSTYDSALKLLTANGLFDLSYIPLSDSYNYREVAYSAPQPIAVDAYDSVYTFFQESAIGSYPSQCLISEETYTSAVSRQDGYRLIAGGRNCGFSGDGGEAANAQIGTQIGQMNFDLVGNLYFSDTGNQRIRRIDALTGIIHTIAGNGTKGYTGDNGPATTAELYNPSGVAVDSQGQVFIISGTGVNGAQLVRKVGANGALTFASQAKGTKSAAQTISIENTGNSALTVTNVVITGADAGDFKIDVNTTSCNFAAGNSLGAGQSCQIGVIFDPAATGTRTATMTLLDNTVTNANLVVLRGTGH